MTTVPHGSGFDQLARRYDKLWSTTPSGIHQRNAVWRVIQPLFKPGDSVLDVGCGTGVDARFLTEAGIRVEAVDASAEMVSTARGKGVLASQLKIEDLPTIGRLYDGALSNFGVLNCVMDLQCAAESLGTVVRPGGFLAICTMGACCLWETYHFLRLGQLQAAIRRWRYRTLQTSIGITIHYPRVNQIKQAFKRHFRLLRWLGIGISVPPSYVTDISAPQAARYARFDRVISSWPLLRAMADHRLLVFVRI